MERIDIHIALEGEDLRQLHALLHSAEHSAESLGEDNVCAKADELLKEVAAASAPAFVKERMGMLSNLLSMVRDVDYAFDAELRKPVIAALAYFVNPNDLIPDNVPTLGYIDDAIMVEVIARDLEAELEAYAEFATFRDAEVARRGADIKFDRESFLAEKRRQMFERIRVRRRSR